MGAAIRRSSQKHLVYPLAVFAVIVPTVLMALYGTWALREVELRPTTFRSELYELQGRTSELIEEKLAALAQIPPPASDSPDEIDRAAAEAQAYLADYTRAVSSRADVGVLGEIRRTQTADANTPPPAELLAFLASLRQPAGGRRILSVERQALEGDRRACYVVFLDGDSGGFIAWEIKQSAIDLALRELMQNVSFSSETLSADILDRSEVRWQGRIPGQEEIVGAVPVHPEIMPWRTVVLRLDTSAQLLNDNTLLSSIYVVIAVLAVPIVAAATLLSVQMILREATEARKKVDFVSNVSHELKTPLTSIRMYVETLKLGRVKDPAMFHTCLDTILSETRRLSNLIDHVLSFSKVENQVKKYNMQPENLAQVVRDTVGLFKEQMRGVEGEVRLKVLPGLPSGSLMDKDAIREVLLNLLSNAIKYSGDEKFVTVVTGLDRNDLFVEVADRGIGIDPSDHARIFEKFYRVDEALTRKVDGTGLGLAICREIVEAHGGRIALQSVRGQGSRFTVYIPYRPPNPKLRSKATDRPSTREMAILPPQDERKGVAS